MASHVIQRGSQKSCPGLLTISALDLSKFTKSELAAWDDKMAKLVGVNYLGFNAP